MNRQRDGMGPTGYVSPERQAQLRAAACEAYATNAMFLVAEARPYVAGADGSAAITLLVKIDSLLERFRRDISAVLP